jgi:uncharacterized membrane protein (DUF485 family)
MGYSHAGQVGDGIFGFLSHGKFAGKAVCVSNAAESSEVQRLAGSPDWGRIAGTDEFRRLLSAKRRFILPHFAFFSFYFLSLHVLTGFAPGLMSTKVLGAVTLGYLFALSQFVVGGVIAVLYLRASAKFDSLIAQLLKNESAAVGGK